jgi:hypothetical protein
MTELQPLLRKMIARWRKDQVKVPKGVSESNVAAFETQWGVKLPADMREYFLTVDGMGNRAEMDEAMFGFWPLEEVRPVEMCYPHVTQSIPHAAGYFIFCDYSIELFVYAIRLSRDENPSTPIAMIYPQVECSFATRYRSFTELLTAYAAAPDDLL